MAIFIDLETTGFSPTNGAVILSIGMIADDHRKDSPISEIEMYIVPTQEEWEKASPQALEVNGLTLDFLQEYGKPLPVVRAKLCEWLADSRVWLGTDVIGQNPDFDFRFLRYYMGSDLLNTGFPVHRNPIDVIELAKNLTHKDPTFKVPCNESGRPSFKGSNISIALGLPPEPAFHRAITGAHACRNNYYALLERLNAATKTVRFR